MKVVKKEQAPQYDRDGVRSYLLVAESTTGAKHVTTTFVEMQVGAVQPPHSHETEQCYMIVQGQGTMLVGDEDRTVVAGDTVFIPSNCTHGLKNDGGQVLQYFSAGSPVFGAEREKRIWPIPPAIPRGPER